MPGAEGFHVWLTAGSYAYAEGRKVGAGRLLLAFVGDLRTLVAAPRSSPVLLDGMDQPDQHVHVDVIDQLAGKPITCCSSGWPLREPHPTGKPRLRDGGVTAVSRGLLAKWQYLLHYGAVVGASEPGGGIRTAILAA
jgi:hypothetical protein